MHSTKQIEQIPFISVLESDSNHRAFHPSTPKKWRKFHSFQCWNQPQTTVHSPSQHSSTWWSDHRAFHQSTQYHVVVRSSCIPPVNTVPQGGQITVHSTSQHITTWWSDHRVFHQSTQYYTVVKSSCSPLVNTVPHGGQIIVHSTS